MILDSLHCSVRKVRWLAMALIVSAAMINGQARAQQIVGPSTPQLYSQGDPTDEEQYLLERLNRARMDPVGEGQRLADWLRNATVGQEIVSQYGTNPDQVAGDFAQLPAVQPLAFNSDLSTAALAHSADIAPHNGQGPNNDVDAYWSGTNAQDAVYATGLRDVSGNNAYYGENAFGDVVDLDTIHAGYLIDWGNSDMGHRKLEMNGLGPMSLVGLGVEFQPDGRLSDTELYAAGVSNSSYLTGVVYNDANGNGLYDVGEGVSGVMVTVDGGASMAVSSASGGYSVPLVRADGTNITGAVAVHMMNLPDGSTRDATVTVKTVTLSNGYADPLNVKWDAITSESPSLPAGVTLSGGGATISRSTKGKVFVLVQRPTGDDASQALVVPLVYKGNAVAGMDYKALPVAVTIPAGAASYRIKIKALDSDASDTRATLTIKVKGEKGPQSKATVTLAP